mmetsp:Transcript_8750/g.12953  ORF Transcript_8750/g.12953 Transcript_8750/m.12953 type:complete len:277 (+) Transcript_8750:78-908(+)
MVDMKKENKGGFDFSNFRRNDMMMKQHKIKMPTATKTGTTICGVVYNGGVVLGADTRATAGVVVDKNCTKIHYIAPNIYCCGAGTAADTENVTGMTASELTLHRYATGKESRVTTSLTILKRHLFKYQGHVSAALVLGGVDNKGPHIHTVYPHGSVDTLPYVTMGSGSLAAMSVFEKDYKENMSKEEAMNLVHGAISAGIYNDLGSGSNVDMCIITKEKTTYIKGYDTSNQRKARRTYPLIKGTTPVISEKVEEVKKLFKRVVVVEEETTDKMEDE